MNSWITDTLRQFGYLGIAGLTILENIFPPLPSELIIPAAGFSAEQGYLNAWLVALAGTLGSLIGAWLLYGLGYLLATDQVTRFIDRYGAWFGISGSEWQRAQKWFNRHGWWAILGARVVPAVRSIISIPAGISRYPFLRFTLLTLIGSAVWIGLLTAAGYYFGSNYEQIARPLQTSGRAIGIALAVLIGGWLLYRLIQNCQKKK